jgi:hypothetical protein
VHQAFHAISSIINILIIKVHTTLITTTAMTIASAHSTWRNGRLDERLGALNKKTDTKSSIVGVTMLSEGAGGVDQTAHHAS